MGKNRERGGRQQGAQRRAPGQHGDKTVGKIQQNRLNAGAHAADERDAERTGPRHDPAEIEAHDTTGRDRLFEDRQQHDEAEKNSEKTRVARDVDRHGHVSADELDARSRASKAKRKS